MNYLSFKEFVDVYGLKDQATSNIKIKEVLDQLTIPAGNYMRDDKSEKPVMITTRDNVHLKCDCVDGSIGNGIREQIIFYINLTAPCGYKIKKNPTLYCIKK